MREFVIQYGSEEHGWTDHSIPFTDEKYVEDSDGLDRRLRHLKDDAYHYVEQATSAGVMVRTLAEAKAAEKRLAALSAMGVRTMCREVSEWEEYTAWR